MAGGAGRFRAAAKRRVKAPDGRASRAVGALLGTFVGDALGMPYEGMRAATIPDAIEMRPGRLPVGHYTDDTEMMIAVAESLLRCDVADAEDLAASFRASFDARRGYGGGTLQVMELWRRGVPVATAAQHVFDGRGSFGNGAAMRVAPVAVRFAGDKVLVDRQARASARVTHAHPHGVDGAAVQAAAIAGARFGAAAIPARWTLALERGPLGREYVEQLARSLAEASTTAVMHRRGPQH
jgi:poly(ADP-ribose) glycohydrolase ARH3